MYGEKKRKIQQSNGRFNLKMVFDSNFLSPFHNVISVFNIASEMPVRQGMQPGEIQGIYHGIYKMYKDDESFSTNSVSKSAKEIILKKGKEDKVIKQDNLVAR